MSPWLSSQVRHDRLLKAMSTFREVWLHAQRLSQLHSGARKIGKVSSAGEKKNQQPVTKKVNSEKDIICHHCHQPGHIRPNCPQRQQPGASVQGSMPTAISAQSAQILPGRPRSASLPNEVRNFSGTRTRTMSKSGGKRHVAKSISWAARLPLVVKLLMRSLRTVTQSLMLLPFMLYTTPSLGTQFPT